MSIQNILKIIIAILVVLIIYLSLQIIRLENYHYAVQVGLCSDVGQLERDKCLNNKETRTNPIFHLLYGIRIL